MLTSSRIKSGHYTTEVDGVRYEIIKGQDGLWSVIGSELEYLGHTKKDCMRYIARSHDLDLPTTTTFDREESNWEVNQRNDGARNHCVPNTFARALAEDPDDLDEVAEWARLVTEDLLMIDAVSYELSESGIFYGCVVTAAADLGIEGREIKGRKEGRAGRQWHRNKSMKTVAQMLQEHPEVEEAIFWVTGHAGYYRNGVAYSLKPRQRVDGMLVIEPDREP